MNNAHADPDQLMEQALQQVKNDDPAALCDALAKAAEQHVSWHEKGLSLVASRNLLSPRARAMMASGLMERVTGGGWVGRRKKSGNAMIDRIEALLVQLARQVFGAEWVEYRAPTGSVANALFVLAATSPGEKVIALPPQFGGHGTLGTAGYGGAHALAISDLPCTDDDSVEIDLERTAEAVERVQPSWIFIGSSRPLFPYPLAELRQIANAAGARILYDAAHILGLYAGGCFQDPLGEGADFVTASTHKTFPGPVGGLCLTNDAELGDRIRHFTTTAIGNYHNNRAAALAVTLAEMSVFAEAYAAATVRNARALAEALDAVGLTVVGKPKGFTRSHVVMLDLSGAMDTTEAWKRLETAMITCEANSLPSAYPKQTALRLGATSLTRRGMGPDEMTAVARFLARLIRDREDPTKVAPDVLQFSAAFADLHYCL